MQNDRPDYSADYFYELNEKACSAINQLYAAFLEMEDAAKRFKSITGGYDIYLNALNHSNIGRFINVTDPQIEVKNLWIDIQNDLLTMQEELVSVNRE